MGWLLSALLRGRSNPLAAAFMPVILASECRNNEHGGPSLLPLPRRLQTLRVLALFFLAAGKLDRAPTNAFQLLGSDEFAKVSSNPDCARISSPECAGETFHAT